MASRDDGLLQADGVPRRLQAEFRESSPGTVHDGERGAAAALLEQRGGRPQVTLVVVGREIDGHLDHPAGLVQIAALGSRSINFSSKPCSLTAPLPFTGPHCGRKARPV